MMKKKILFVALALMVFLALSGCQPMAEQPMAEQFTVVEETPAALLVIVENKTSDSNLMVG